MGIGVERIVPPFGRAKSGVLRQCALARVLLGTDRATRSKGEIFEKAHCRLAGELHLPARSNRQMGHPVEVGACQRAGRQTPGEPRHGGMQGAVEIRQRVGSGRRPADFRFRLRLKRLEFSGGCVDEGGCVGHWSNSAMRQLCDEARVQSPACAMQRAAILSQIKSHRPAAPLPSAFTTSFPLRICQNFSRKTAYRVFRSRSDPMNNNATDLDEADEALIAHDLSDEALEAAASGDGQRATTWAYCSNFWTCWPL